MSAIPRSFTLLGTGTGISSTAVIPDKALVYGSGGGRGVAGSLNLTFTDGTTTGQLIHPVGAAATPSLTFLGDTDTGLYWVSANTMGFTSAGTASASFTRDTSGGGLDIVALGSNQNLYFASSGTGTVSLVANASRLDVVGTTNGSITLTPSGTGQVLAGTGGVPAYSFVGDTDTGISRPGANQLDILAGGAAKLRFEAAAGNSITVPSTNTFEFGQTARAKINVSADTTVGVMTFTSPSAGSFNFTGGNLAVAGALITTPQALSGAGAIDIVTTATDFTSTGGAQALSLANAVVGQFKTITHVVDGGSGVLTPTTAVGFSTITFTNAGESALLRYTSAGWAIISLNGAIAA